MDDELPDMGSMASNGLTIETLYTVTVGMYFPCPYVHNLKNTSCINNLNTVN